MYLSFIPFVASIKCINVHHPVTKMTMIFVIVIDEPHPEGQKISYSRDV